MGIRFNDFKNKEVINVKDGAKYGKINDIEIDIQNSRLVSVIVYGKMKWFGMLGREDDYVIKWEDIETIGDDAVLVNSRTVFEKKKKKFFNKIL